jgi:hypothetical protein
MTTISQGQTPSVVLQQSEVNADDRGINSLTGLCPQVTLSSGPVAVNPRMVFESQPRSAIKIKRMTPFFQEKHCHPSTPSNPTTPSFGEVGGHILS